MPWWVWALAAWLGLCTLFTWALARWFKWLRDDEQAIGDSESPREGSVDGIRASNAKHGRRRL